LFHNVIDLRYIETGSELGRAISVLKMRNSRHEMTLSSFAITDHGIAVGKKTRRCHWAPGMERADESRLTRLSGGGAGVRVPGTALRQVRIFLRYQARLGRYRVRAVIARHLAFLGIGSAAAIIAVIKGFVFNTGRFRMGGPRLLVAREL
jgi:KaiC